MPVGDFKEIHFLGLFHNLKNVLNELYEIFCELLKALKDLYCDYIRFVIYAIVDFA